MSQAGICKVARVRCDMSRIRVVELLRLGVGKRWIVRGGMYNSLLYYPMEKAESAHAQDDHTQIIVQAVQSKDEAVNAWGT
jgi:hypothetical protein